MCRKVLAEKIVSKLCQKGLCREKFSDTIFSAKTFLICSHLCLLTVEQIRLKSRPLHSGHVTYGHLLNFVYILLLFVDGFWEPVCKPSFPKGKIKRTELKDAGSIMLLGCLLSVVLVHCKKWMNNEGLPPTST